MDEQQQYDYYCQQMQYWPPQAPQPQYWPSQPPPMQYWPPQPQYVPPCARCGYITPLRFPPPEEQRHTYYEDEHEAQEPVVGPFMHQRQHQRQQHTPQPQPQRFQHPPLLKKPYKAPEQKEVPNFQKVSQNYEHEFPNLKPQKPSKENKMWKQHRKSQNFTPKSSIVQQLLHVRVSYRVLLHLLRHEPGVWQTLSTSQVPEIQDLVKCYQDAVNGTESKDVEVRLALICADLSEVVNRIPDVFVLLEDSDCGADMKAFQEFRQELLTSAIIIPNQTHYESGKNTCTLLMHFLSSLMQSLHFRKVDSTAAMQQCVDLLRRLKVNIGACDPMLIADLQSNQAIKK